MSAFYNPDPDAQATGKDFYRILSDRDLSLQIPVNYVHVPGVSLTQACFPRGHYDLANGTRCISNLLAVGFRRLYIDLYWDVSRATWSLCPVELGSVEDVPVNVTTTLVPPPASATLSDGVLSERRMEDVTPDVGDFREVVALRPRQTNSPSSSDTADQTSATILTAEPLNPPPATSTLGLSGLGTTTNLTAALSSSSLYDDTLPDNAPDFADINGATVRVGQYVCSPSLDFDLFNHLLTTHLQDTEYSTNATTKYLILNLHAAAPAEDPDGSAQQPDQDDMPSGSNQLSAALSANASSFLYGPSSLFSQRQSLNASGNWFSVLRSNQPDAGYFSVVEEGDDMSTPNGWPSESYVEIQYAKRLFAAFGSIDPQMQSYNLGADSGTIFDRDYLESQQYVATTFNGELESGCFFNDGVTSLSSVNSSWAVASDVATPILENTDIGTILDLAGNLTDCGIAAVLNYTLGDTTADEDFRPYRDYVLRTIWSWGLNEPRNATGQEYPQDEYRCSTMEVDTGRWKVEDCGRNHYAACRVGDSPYDWRISDSSADYAKVALACNDDTDFSAPRTALENRYLWSQWQSWRENAGDGGDGDGLLWLNFNSLDVANCWVLGQNTTCPYSEGGIDRQRQLIVPTVAGVIVMVLAALTVFVKCAANRQTRRRHGRRGDDGWAYDTIPA